MEGYKELDLRRDAFAKYIFDKEWAEFGGRTVNMVSISNKREIGVLFNKLHNDEKHLTASYDEFLLKTGIKESDFQSGSVE